VSGLRLQPGNWAGAYVCWGTENREAALRFVVGAGESGATPSAVSMISDLFQARERAKARFCEDQALHHWSLHADRIQVRPADFPS